MKRDTKIGIIAIVIAAVITSLGIFGTPLIFPPTAPEQISTQPTIPPVFDVVQGVNGSDYSARWGDMMQQYQRGLAFYTIEGRNVFLGTYIDLAANSVRNPADRPGLLLSRGTWVQNGSVIVVDYSSTYLYKELKDIQLDNVTHYDYEEILNCLDLNCTQLMDKNRIVYSKLPHYEVNLSATTTIAAVGAGGDQP